jgi:hypothetical protein
MASSSAFWTVLWLVPKGKQTKTYSFLLSMRSVLPNGFCSLITLFPDNHRLMGAHLHILEALTLT